MRFKYFYIKFFLFLYFVFDGFLKFGGLAVPAAFFLNGGDTKFEVLNSGS